MRAEAMEDGQSELSGRTRARTTEPTDRLELDCDHAPRDTRFLRGEFLKAAR